MLICGTDLQAIGAIDECRRRGIRVPEELSITGFDDIEHTAIVAPPLTTVKVMEGQALTPALPLETKVIERESLGAAPDIARLRSGPPPRRAASISRRT